MQGSDLQEKTAQQAITSMATTRVHNSDTTFHAKCWQHVGFHEIRLKTNKFISVSLCVKNRLALPKFRMEMLKFLSTVESENINLFVSKTDWFCQETNVKFQKKILFTKNVENSEKKS